MHNYEVAWNYTDEVDTSAGCGGLLGVHLKLLLMLEESNLFHKMLVAVLHSHTINQKHSCLSLSADMPFL